MNILPFLPLLLSVVIVTNGAPIGGNCMTPLGTIIPCRRDVIGTKIQADYTQDQQLFNLLDNEDQDDIERRQLFGAIGRWLGKIVKTVGKFFKGVGKTAVEYTVADSIGQAMGQATEGGYNQFGGIQEQDLFNSIDKTQEEENEERQFIGLIYLLQKLLSGPQNNQQNHQFGGVGEEQKMNEITDFLDEDTSNYNGDSAENRKFLGFLVGVVGTVINVITGGAL